MYYCLTGLLLVTASSVSAAPQVQAPASSLPSSLQNVVPSCAQSCFATQINRQFPSACTSEGDLECLCGQYGSDSKTLGEVALACYDSACQTTSSQRTSVYNVCSAVAGRVAPTLTGITLNQPKPTTVVTLRSTQAVVITIARSSSSGLATKTSSVFATSAVGGQIQSSMVNVPDVPVSTLVLGNETPVPVSSVASAASAQQTVQPLKTAQIVGISVAGACALMLCVGLVVAATCVRQRKRKPGDVEVNPAYSEKRAGGSNTVPNDGLGGLRPLYLPAKVLKDPRGGAGGVGIAPVPIDTSRSGSAQSRRSVNDLPPLKTDVSRVQLNDSNANSKWINPDVPANQIGIAISPESIIDSSPGSFRSERTMSRLLPAKPTRPESSASAMTVFEEDAARKSMRQSQVVRPPLPRNDPTKPHFTPPDQSATPPSYAAGFTMSLDSYRSPQSPPVPMPSPLRPAKGGAVQPQPLPTVHEAPRQPQLSLNIPTRSRAPSEQSLPTISSQSRAPSEHPAPSKPLPSIPGAKDHTSSPLRVFVPPVYADVKPSPRPIRNTSVSASSRSSLASFRSSIHSDISTPDTYVPRYYTSTRPSPQKPQQQRKNTPGPANTHVSRPKHSPKLISIRRPNSHSNKTSPSLARSTTTTSHTTTAGTSNRDSQASCTTIESASDEPTPPSDEEDKQVELSPVPESPISGLRYPKVPRASNQLVPRSPTTGLTLDTQAPSLLAKRRGESAAQELQTRLFVSPISSSVRSSATSRANTHRQSQSQGYIQTVRHSRGGSEGASTSRGSTIVRTNVEVPIMLNGPLSVGLGTSGLGSPLWLPRITPTRRGDDLFLSIS